MEPIKISGKKNTDKEFQSRKKWGSALVDAGFTIFPDTILERQKALGLDATDICILLHISRHWWKHNELPWPGLQRIADCIGRDRRTVQRRIAKMESKGLLVRIPRGEGPNGSKANMYDLKPLIKMATPLAEEKIEEIGRRKRDDRNRVNRPKDSKVVSFPTQ